MGTPHDLGVEGERLAVRYLQRLGYTIVARNFRFGHREIDIVARLGDTVAFVEVKTRKGRGYGHPLEAITARKRREVERVAAYWSRCHDRPELCYRFDAVAIIVGEGVPIIDHIPSAWRLGE